MTKVLILKEAFLYDLMILANDKIRNVKTCNQSHYIEVAQGDIFIEQKMRFGLVWGRLAILKKKIWADLYN